MASTPGPIQIDHFVAFGSVVWMKFAGLVIAGRGLDLGSTFAGTPKLLMEGSPMARRIGWKYGIPLNLVAGLASACWPLLAISLATMSTFVAARNLQNAWIMRSMGEEHYRAWLARRIAEAPRWTPYACYLGEALLAGTVGATLLAFADYRLVPCGIGTGILIYGAAIGFFTSLELFRRP